MRKTSFAEGEFYHVYNRGVDKRDIFSEQYDLSRFLQSMREFNTLEPIGSIYEKTLLKIKFGSSTPKLVDVICYCLNPNHFHLILEQVEKNGISELMKRLGGGYTKYFNYHYKRSGALFQGKFKSVRIRTNAHLLYLSAYVNRNYFIHGYGNDSDWRYSSFLDYTKRDKSEICEMSVVLDKFKNKREYQDFIQKNALHMKEKKDDDKLLLE